jgi:hypothetical protein
MKAITKDMTKIPACLADETRQTAFLQNKKNEDYTASNEYKTLEILKDLIGIYGTKCAFCEDSLLNSPKHIEHYRPKKKNKKTKKCCADTSYFWLAFSWDNLLLACGSCNSGKGSCFDIAGDRADYEKVYKTSILSNLQNIITDLDAIEKPLLVNPEQETQSFFDENLIFELKNKESAHISSENERLSYTIRICKLNRKELVEKRLLVLNNLKNAINRRKNDYSLHKDRAKYVRDIALLKQDFQEKLKHNPAFSALRNFILQHFLELIKA